MTGSGIVLRAGAATDVGRMRSVNQDRHLLLPERDLFLLADGMGGHRGGEIAATIALDTIDAAYVEPTAAALAEAMTEANQRIRDAGEVDQDLRGMGTTVVAFALMPEEPEALDRADDTEAAEGDEPDAEAAPEPAPTPEAPAREHVLIASVGDSRAYLFRDGALTQITQDHSVVADLVREGRISAEEAEYHPQRNIVTRVLGPYESVEIDYWPVDPIRGDRYLLCSDGLFGEVGAGQITAVLRRLEDPDDACRELVRLANASGGRDNITAVLIDVLEDGGVAQRASAALAGDMAGFNSALRDGGRGDGSGNGKKPKVSREERRAARKARKAQRTRVTWRFVLFTLLVLAVIGGAIATIQWYGTSTYFVGFDGDEVVIYQGRPGGLLWIDPELQEPTGIDRSEVPARYLDDLEAGNEQPSLEAARQVVENIERDIDDATTPSTSTTTTTSGTTTTRAG